VGQVVTATGDPAAGTRVTLLRAVPRPPEFGSASDDRETDVRYAVSETIASEEGTVEIEGLSREPYEFVALHDQYGRAMGQVTPDGQPFLVRLNPPKQITGRVLRDQAPVPRVAVRLVPDLPVLAAAENPLDYVGGESSTDEDGRFVLALPPRGAAELLIGDPATGVLRQKLRPSDDLMPFSDIGDVELPELLRVVAMLDGRDECHLVATGPIGASGVVVVRAVHRSPGVRDLQLPEQGRWWLSLDCDQREVAVDPSMIDVPEGTQETTVQLQLLEAPPPEN
jgi:hypothetical protein